MFARNCVYYKKFEYEFRIYFFVYLAIIDALQNFSLFIEYLINPVPVNTKLFLQRV